MNDKLKLGIMQPYFFPYLGYFELIARTGKWVIFDVVQYTTRSWMNRNRILHPTKGWQYVGVPIQKARRGTLIQDILIKDLTATKDRILAQIDHYRRHAPFFRDVVQLISNAFSSVKSNKLVDLNIATLVETCAYLKIPFYWSVCSKMGLQLDDIKHPGQWALRIAEQMGADVYINLSGGRDIFDPTEWDEAGIILEFTELPSFTYDCAPYDFVEHLSILDVLMWNPPSVISELIR
jgi:hypothetical protein